MTSSVSVQAAEHDECHPWSFYNDTLQRCQCYESVQDHVIRLISLTECSERKTSYIGHCMTTEQLGTFYFSIIVQPIPQRSMSQR